MKHWLLARSWFPGDSDDTVAVPLVFEWTPSIDKACSVSLSNCSCAPLWLNPVSGSISGGLCLTSRAWISAGCAIARVLATDQRLVYKITLENFIMLFLL